jgi:fatty acid desaturase
MWPIVALCFLSPHFPWAAWLPYVAFLAYNADRVLLMMHVVVHRPLFRRKARWLEGIIHFLIGPLFGATPGSFYAHHVAMHHAEENMGGDLSSTLAYERDNWVDWLKYAVRFQVFGIPSVIAYFWRTGKRRTLRRFVAGEVLFWIVAAGLFWIKPIPALLLLIAPVIVVRFALMAGNFAQHALIQPGNAGSPWGNSYNLLDSRLNARGYNDGHHVVHHLHPGMHWSEMPAWLDAHRAEAEAQGTPTFSGVGDFMEMFVLLMLRRYDILARHHVRAPGDVRSDADVAAWLKTLTRPFPAEAIVPIQAS